jgi:hypothetical protein
MTEKTSDNVVATVIRLSEGYVLALADGRTIGYPNVPALGKGLVRKLRHKARPAVATQPAQADAVALQAFNLSTLVARAQEGAISDDDFERGLQKYCPDVYAQAWARPAIEAARAALASPKSETKKPARRKPVGPTPWVCGYCKRPSDCIFDTGNEMNLRAGVDEPCATCRACLDDECGGEPAPEMEPEIEPAASQSADDEEFDIMQTQVAYIVNETGARIGEMTVEATE